MTEVYQPQHEHLLNKMEGMNQLTNKTSITVADLISRIINDEDLNKKIPVARLPWRRIKERKEIKIDKCNKSPSSGVY